MEYDKTDGNGFSSLKKWLISKPFGLIDDLFGKTKIFSIITSSFKARSTGNSDRYVVANTFISKFLSILSFIYKPA